MASGGTVSWFVEVVEGYLSVWGMWEWWDVPSSLAHALKALSMLYPPPTPAALLVSLGPLARIINLHVLTIRSSTDHQLHSHVSVGTYV
jgi:hypothetical protein